MANLYEKHEWVPEELITEAKLNHMENGIEDAYNRAERHITTIIDNSEDLTQMLKDRITDFIVEIDQEENKLIFKTLENTEENP